MLALKADEAGWRIWNSLQYHSLPTGAVRCAWTNRENIGSSLWRGACYLPADWRRVRLLSIMDRRCIQASHIPLLISRLAPGNSQQTIYVV